MNGREKETLYRTAGYVLALLVLFVCAAAGQKRIDRITYEHVQESIEESGKEAMEESVEQSIEASLEASRAEETAVHTLPLSHAEEEVLTQLSSLLEAGDRAEAARLLNSHEVLLQSLFYEKMEGTLWLYDGASAVDRIEGRGLVFTRPSTVFCGDFRDGKPEGECLALLAVRLDEGDRYDYSEGTFVNGRMNGSGVCGYEYYEGVTGDSTRMITKSGLFREDLMEGGMIYTSVNGDGASTSWSMEVKEGVIVLDERWSLETDPEGKVTYRLLADTDDVHAYAVDGDAMKEARWSNMIVWGE